MKSTQTIAIELVSAATLRHEADLAAFLRGNLELVRSLPALGEFSLSLHQRVRPVADNIGAGEFHTRLDFRSSTAKSAVHPASLLALVTSVFPRMEWKLGKELPASAGAGTHGFELVPSFIELPVQGQQRRPSLTGRTGEWQDGLAIELAMPVTPDIGVLPSLLGYLLQRPEPVDIVTTIEALPKDPALIEKVERAIDICERVVSGRQETGGTILPVEGRIRLADWLRTYLSQRVNALREQPYGVRIAAWFPKKPEALTLAALSTAYSASAKAEQIIPSTPTFRKMVDGQREIPIPCTAAEAAACLLLPVAAGEPLPGVPTRHYEVRGASAAVTTVAPGEPGVDMGCVSAKGQTHPVRLLESDREMPVYITGQTGAGKTTLVKQMLLSDIEEGRGAGLIDPHGDLFKEVLALIPRHRLKDVIILDPTDPHCGVKLNLLELRPGETIHHVAREFVAILERLVIDKHGEAAREWMGPMFNLHISMNLLLIMSNPEEPGTLLDLEEIFSKKDAWKRWEPFKDSDPRLKNWVENVLPGFDYLKDRPDSAPFGQYIYSKLEDFTGDPRLRSILSSPRSSIDFQQIMDEGRILLVNLSRGVFGANNSTFLGLLIVSMLRRAAMARAAHPIEKRRRFHLYVDEFQNLATESFTALLAEGRKFGLSTVLANQFLSQIPQGGLMKALLANLATLVCFRLGPEDARLLEPFFAPFFSVKDLTNLPRFLACASMRVRGQPVEPFSLGTVVTTRKPDPQMESRVRKASRRRLGYQIPVAPIPHQQDPSPVPTFDLYHLEQKLRRADAIRASLDGSSRSFLHSTGELPFESREERIKRFKSVLNRCEELRNQCGKTLHGAQERLRVLVDALGTFEKKEESSGNDSPPGASAGE